MINEKYERLEFVEIPKGLFRFYMMLVLQLKNLLDGGPSHSAEIIGIDYYVGEIIYREIRKALNNLNFNLLINKYNYEIDSKKKTPS